MSGFETFKINHPLVGRNVELDALYGETLTTVADHLGVIRQFGEDDLSVRKRVVESLSKTRRFVSPITEGGKLEREEFRTRLEKENRSKAPRQLEESWKRRGDALRDIGQIVREIERLDLHPAVAIASDSHLASHCRDIKRAILNGLRRDNNDEPKKESEKPATGFLSALEEIDDVK